jgi:hypothetical protein
MAQTNCCQVIIHGIGWALEAISGSRMQNEHYNMLLKQQQGNKKIKIAAKTPFVIGAIIELGNCLDLVETASLEILKESYNKLKEIKDILEEKMPVNRGNNRALDCSVIKYIHQANADSGKPPLDTIRCAYPEGEEIYPGATISSRLHIQICVCNPECIKGYFLPKPLSKYNPYL